MKFSGNVSGALFAAVLASGVGWQLAEKVYWEMANDAVQKGVIQKMSIYHEYAIEIVLGYEVNIYQKLNGKLFVGISTWFDECQLISSWDNNEELRDTLHASMHIPYYCTHIAKVKCNDGIFRRAILLSTWFEKVW